MRDAWPIQKGRGGWYNDISLQTIKRGKGYKKGKRRCIKQKWRSSTQWEGGAIESQNGGGVATEGEEYGVLAVTSIKINGN